MLIYIDYDQDITKSKRALYLEIDSIPAKIKILFSNFLKSYKYYDIFKISL